MEFSGVSHLQGREQAELTGLRLASLGLKFNKIVHSSMTRAVETTEIISKHLPGECLAAPRPSAAGLKMGGPGEACPEGVTRSPCFSRRGLQGQYRPAAGRCPHRARPARVPLEAGGCGKTPTPLGSTPAPPLHPSACGPRAASVLKVPYSAPSSITKTGPGSRPPSGTTSTGRTPSSRRTAMRSSSATPTSSATSCAGEGPGQAQPLRPSAGRAIGPVVFPG